MTDEDKAMTRQEALSALADGELDAAEIRQMVDRLLNDPALRARWASYHAARAALDGTGAGRLGADFRARVAEAVAAEPAILAPARPPRPARRWLTPVAAVVAAACVAVVAVGVVLALRDGTGGEQIAPTVADADGAGPARVAAGDTMPGGEVRDRLAVFVLNHNRFAGGGEMPAVMPASRLVGLNGTR